MQLSEDVAAFVDYFRRELDELDGFGCIALTLAPAQRDVARYFGWDHCSPTWGMPDELRLELAELLGRYGAQNAQAFVEANDPGSLLLMYGHAVLLIRRCHDGAYAVVPQALPN